MSYLHKALLPLVLIGACSPPVNLIDHVVQLPNGTGTVIAEGWVLTAKHVARHLPEGPDRIDHPELDVSLVRWDTEGKTVVEVASQSPGVGSRVLLVGIAAGRTQVISGGFSGVFFKYPLLGSLTCEGSSGMSGGAVLVDGKLVGIYLGSFAVRTILGWVDSPSEQRYLRVEAFREWLAPLVVLGF